MCGTVDRGPCLCVGSIPFDLPVSTYSISGYHDWYNSLWVMQILYGAVVCQQSYRICYVADLARYLSVHLHSHCISLWQYWYINFLSVNNAIMLWCMCRPVYQYRYRVPASYCSLALHKEIDELKFLWTSALLNTWLDFRLSVVFDFLQLPGRRMRICRFGCAHCWSESCSGRKLDKTSICLL